MFPKRRPALCESSKWAFHVVAILVSNLGVRNLQSSLFCQDTSLSTQFTGIGAVEHSLQFLAAAAIEHGLHFSCHVRWGCDKNQRCQEHMINMCGEQHCMFTDILDLLSHAHLINDASFHSLDILLKVQIIRMLMRNSHAWCAAHRRLCPLIFTTIAFAGSPCPDHSRMGSHVGLQGFDAILLLVWLAFHRSAHTPVLFHENVKGFPCWVVSLVMADMYWVYELEVDTWQVGYALMRRPLIVIVILHKLRIILVHDMLRILHMVFAHLSAKKTVALDCWGASKEEFQKEYEYLVSTRLHLKRRPDLPRSVIDILTAGRKGCAMSACANASRPVATLRVS